MEAFNHWLELPEDTLGSIIQIIDMLHNASLLIDDVEDDSKLRRGSPAAHTIFGLGTTINSSNYVYFQALKIASEMDNRSAKRTNLVSVFVEEVLNLHRGQGWDIHWRDQGVCPNMSEYEDMVLDKTGESRRP